MQLQPDLPEAHLALGFSYYYGDKNYEAALREFEIARLGLPNESEVYLAIGAIQRRQGKWAHSIANMEKAASLNPKDTWALQNLTYNYTILRKLRCGEQNCRPRARTRSDCDGAFGRQVESGYRGER